MTNTSNTVSEVQTTQKEPNQEQRTFTFKATYLVWLVFGILEALIALRIGLKLIGANAASPIAVFIYGFTDFFLRPFQGLVGTPAVGSMVMEITSLIAMVVYALIAWALERIVWVIFYRPRGPVVAVTKTSSIDQNTDTKT
jgi:hypothetical protein